MSANLAALAYLAPGVLFILTLRGLSSPVTSRRGNMLGMIPYSFTYTSHLAVTAGLAVALFLMVVVMAGSGARSNTASRAASTSCSRTPNAGWPMSRSRMCTFHARPGWPSFRIPSPSGA